MKIGISINGEGRGHLSRARAIAEQLSGRYEIAFWAPHHLLGELRSSFPAAEAREIPHFRFVQRGFTLDWAATIAANARLALESFNAVALISKGMKEAGISALLSDFEPFASRAARARGIPVIQLNHPSVVERSKEGDLAHFLERAAACVVSRYMTACADRTIVCSFFDGDVGPIIRQSLRARRVTRGDYLVAYVKREYRDALEPVIASIGRGRFRVFPDPAGDYDGALAGCRALIAPAGHQAISEALALGKPVFAIPVSGQYEQLLNARKLRESGFGDWSRADAVPEALPEFLDGLDRYERAIALSRLSRKTEGFRCEDETFRAACMVESFILERARRASRRRGGTALEAAASLR